MTTYINKRNSTFGRPVKKLIFPLLVVMLVFYLIFHVLSGERGIYAMLKEERRLEVLQTELAEAKAERRELETRVRLISPDSLDVDMLDEQARMVLDAAGTDEVVIPVNSGVRK